MIFSFSVNIREVLGHLSEPLVVITICRTVYSEKARYALA